MRAVALAIAAVLLAGCSGDAPPTSGEPTTSASPSAAMAPPAPPPPAVHGAVCQADSGISYGISGVGGSGQPATCPFADALTGDLSALQAAIVEVVWTPGTTMTGAQLLIQSDSCWQGTRLGADASLEQGTCDEGNLQGATSPLRLELNPGALQRHGNDNLTAMVLAHGVTTSQPFTIYVTLFEGLPPAGFSAIPT